jgi:ribosomal protein L7/L12
MNSIASSVVHRPALRTLCVLVFPAEKRIPASTTIGAHSNRHFSTNHAKTDIGSEPLVFRSEKVRDLFRRVTDTCSKEDIKELSRVINEDIFGRPFRKNEFFYRGFGGRGAGTGSSSAQVSEEPVVEVKQKFDLKLVGYDAKAKIKVIKEVRSIAGLGLKEAKELVDGVPAMILKDLNPELAQELKAKLEEAGATIELA